MTDGIELFNLFVPMAIEFKDVQRLIEVGIGPLKLFEDISKTWRFDRDPPKNAIFPFNRLEFICSVTREASELIDKGIVPDIEFEETTKVVNELKLDIDDGIVPFNEREAKFIATTDPETQVTFRQLLLPETQRFEAVLPEHFQVEYLTETLSA